MKNIDLDTNMLARNIQELTETVIFANTPWWVFLKGVIAGVGTAIGASLVVGAILYALSKLAAFIDLPFTGMF